MIRAATALIALAFLLPPGAQAQHYINQTAIEAILTSNRVEDVHSLPEVDYQFYVMRHTRNNAVLARNTLYLIIGDGDQELGRERSKLLELLNRRLIATVGVGDSVVIPSKFDLDFRAYSPFPRLYEGGSDFNKLFIIDKSVQAWAAYEYGSLVRWGIVNTGSEASRTPNGRFNFNWKVPFRVSSESPPGERWEMHWVFNIHVERGIHIHQYEMPTGGPVSRGCVRLIDDDAKWIYNWADPWQTANGHGEASIGAPILRQGTTVLVIGEDPSDNPMPFRTVDGRPQLKRLQLPAHPFDVPPGTAQQVRFDRLRASR
jgi:hypothetical protein